jgi:steroid 5-alpha reductase family enzyme
MVSALDSRMLAVTALVTAGYQLVFGSIAYACKFDKLTDFAGGTNFLVLAVLTFALGTAGGGNGPYPRQIVLSALVVLWALRLALFLLYRILLWGEDQRFDGRRDQLARVVAFWSLQAVWVWTVSLPLTILNASKRNPPLGALDYVGWTLFFVGLAMETTADFQKLFFKQNLPEDNKGRWTDVGVWKWTRHPNYFGEMLLWTAAFISACRVFEGLDWIAALGPIFIILLLLFVSGIPLLEERADKKHGKKEDYRRYKQRTSVLFPIPNALYAPLPGFIKRTVLLDFPLYNPVVEAAAGAGDDVKKHGKSDCEGDVGSESPDERTPIKR